MEAAEYWRMAELQDRHWWFEAKRRTVAALLDRHAGRRSRAAGAGATGGRPAGDAGFGAGLGDAAARVLEVGSGTGAMGPIMRQRGRLFATDASVPALHLLRERRAAGDTTASIGATLQQLPFADGTFSLVGCFDVLYHRGVPRVPEALRELNRVCAPGGHLAITDSAFAALRSSHDVATHAARRFRLPDLVEQLEEAGFTTVHASYFHTLLFPVAAVVRGAKRLLHGTPELGGETAVAARSDLGEVPGWANRLLLSAYRLEIPLTVRFRMPFGVSLMVLARRVV